MGFLASSGSSQARPPIRDHHHIDWNMFKGTWEILAAARHGRGVWLSILGISWFFAVGAVLMSEFAPLVSGTLAAKQEVATLFLVVFSLAIAAGSLLVNRLLQRRGFGALCAGIGAGACGRSDRPVALDDAAFPCERRVPISRSFVATPGAVAYPDRPCRASPFPAACSSCRSMPSSRPAARRRNDRGSSRRTISSMPGHRAGGAGDNRIAGARHGVPGLIGALGFATLIVA